MYRRLKKIIAIILCLCIMININHIEGLIGLIQREKVLGEELSQSTENEAVEVETEEATEEVSEEIIEEEASEPSSEAEINNSDSIQEEETTTSEENIEDDEIKDGEYQVSYMAGNPNKTTVSATNALNYASYDDINIGVYTHEDWKNLVAITHKTDLKGVDVILSNDSSKETDKQTWDLTLADLAYTDGTNTYYGLGSKEYPFAGNLVSQFTLTVKPKVALFNYLSSDAEIGTDAYSLTINYVAGTNNIKAGLAENLILESGDYSWNYTKLTITGYIGSTNGGSDVSGGLFAYVKAKDETVTDAKFVIDNNMNTLSNITNVYGKIAGGIIGVVEEGVTVELSGCPQLPSIVRSSETCAGGVIGKLNKGAVLLTNSTEASPVILQHGTEGKVAARVAGAGYTGGLIGWVQDAQVNISYVKKYDSIMGTKYVGGLIGLAESTSADSPVKIIVSDFVLAAQHVAQNGTASTESYCVGGVIGKYLTALDDTASKLEVYNITSEGATRENSDTSTNFPRLENANIADKDQYYFNGGVVGGIYGNNAKIHDIEFDSDSYKINQIWNLYNESNTNQNGNGTWVYSTKSAGTIAGSAVGKNIEIDNIVVGLEKSSQTSAYWSSGLSGKTIGGLIGRVGYFNGSNVTGSKIKVSDIDIVSFFTWSPGNTCGGLFGDVGKGSIISLGGEIDLSGLSKTTQDATTYTDLVGNAGSKGFIAGKSYESLIYFELDTNVTRPVTIQNEIIYFDSVAGGSANSDNFNYRYSTIDDIGNYGSVYQNIKDENGNPVIVFSNTEGSEVTGTVGVTSVESNEYYVIDSLADALRLSIAGHTFDSDNTKKPRFAASCFSDKTITEILSSNFLIQTDLKLSAAGIHGLVRNDSLSYGFSGIMKGDTKADGSKYVITMDFMSRQYFGGLFPQLTSGDSIVTFENLTFDGCVAYEKPLATASGGAGILAANLTGGITIKKVDVTAKLKASYISGTSVWDNGTMYCYGGFVGNVNLGKGTINVDGCTVSPDISIVHNHYFVGGLFGKVTTAEGSDISVINSVISTKYTADSRFSEGAPNNTNHARYGGLIGFVGYSYSDVGNTNGVSAVPGAVVDKTYTKVLIDNCEVKDSKLDLTNANSTNLRASGGFLGYAWCNIEATIKNITIDGDSKIYSRGYVGGLLSFVSGKCDVSNININSLEMKNTYGSNITYSSFLFGNAQNAFITLDQATYNINTENGKVTATGYSNFDEIVGMNLSVDYCNNLNSSLNTGYYNGGILNIINSNFKSFKTEDYSDDESYDSYRNRVITTSNKYTRYYYNLFVGEEEEWIVAAAGNKAVIDSPKKMMTWHVSFFANSNIRRFFNGYYSSITNYSTINTVSIESELDMNGYSLYPTQITNKTINGNGHKITLYGQEISDLEKTLYNDGAGVTKIYRNNEHYVSGSNTQHYMMHASLFYNVSGASNINGITLSGTVAYNHKYTGALIGGGIVGTATIKDIVADNIKISHYGSTAIDGCGLLISRIGLTGWATTYTNVAANVTIDNIETINYAGDSQVAAALIGYVGSSEATNVRVYFTNMRVSDETADNVFKYASFIYDYDYTDDIESNNCYGLYIFNYADTVTEETDEATGNISYVASNHNVTYGSEIAKNVEYNDCLKSSISASDANPLQVAIDKAKADESFYLPYVYKTRSIYVNPQNGNITEGCGTYEDPYIIKNQRQFLSLYCYLTGKTIYYDMLGEKTGTDGTGVSAWTVNKIGGNGQGYECSEQVDNVDDIEAHVAVKFALVDGEISEEFPSKDDLRTAYYRIEADLNLEEITDLNDYLLIQEYNGLGTQTYPFAGVIAGTKLADGSYPTITLPRQGEDNISQSNYGLIQYMQGAVIKDLNIITPIKNADETDEIFVNITGYAGGVAAIVLGGDNIIDNVTTSMRFTAYNTANYNSSTTMLGGYVGVIRNGSVILRNISGKKVVAGCEFKHYNTSSKTETYYKYDDATTDLADTNSAYEILLSAVLAADENPSEYVGLLVGKVEDGYVIYEHNDVEKAFEDTNIKVLSRDELEVSNDKNNLEIINGFNIINGYVLDKAVETDGKIDVKSDADGNLTVDIKNGDELEIMALALNSDSLSVYYSALNGRASSHSTYGYDYTARCRKADYSSIGTKSDDRNIAQALDDGKSTDESNIYMYPYLCYKYMNFDETGASSGSDITSLKDHYNIYINKTLVTQTVTDAEKEYIVYSSKFNKINDAVKKYTTTYELNKDNSVTVFDVSDYGISFRGFGALYSVGHSDFRANFNGNGKNVKIYMDRAFEPNKDFPAGMFNSLTYDTRIGKTATDRGTAVDLTVTPTPLVIENVNIVDSIFKNVDGTFTGAIAGKVEGVWDFKDISVKVTEDYSTKEDSLKPVIEGKTYVGGIIGSINSTKWLSTYNDNLHFSSNIINIERCNISGITGSEVNINGVSGTVAVGGIVGGIGRYPATNSNNYEYYFGDISIEDCKVSETQISLGNTGNAGGFAGHVGYRKENLSYSTVGIVNISNSETYTDNNIENVTIKNVVQDSNVTESSIGGVLGKAQVADRTGGNNYGYITVDGFNISKLNIVPSEGVTGLTYKQDNHVNETTGIHPSNNNGIGGIIGFNRTQNTDLFNISISDSVIGTNDTSNLSTGGLIGYNQLVQGSGLTAAVKTNAENVVIKSSKILSNVGRAGAYIGDARTEVNTFTDCIIEDCEIISNTEYVGGVIGYFNPNLTGYTTTVSNQQVINTTIQTLDNSSNGGNTISAGGVIGYVYNKNNTIELSEIYVGEGCNIRGSKAGGGIFGSLESNVKVKMNDWIGVGAKYDTDTKIWTEDTTFNNISGRICGGITGSDLSTSERAIAAPLYVAHNRIYSYDRMKNATGRCGSGGLAGYKGGNSASIIYDDVTIKNNIIITSGRCGAASNCYGTGNNAYMPAVGGMYGRMEGSSGAATHIPNITLENNSIGFYDVSTFEENDDKYLKYKELNLESDDVKLFYYDTDNTLKSVNWKEAEINESNVGRYSIGIGNFVGYINSTRQVNILRPTVTYSENIGSIPAVDVGNISYGTGTAQYGTSYPYAYRSSWHIIYLSEQGTATNTILDNSITSAAGEDEYFFGNIENIVDGYKQVKNQSVDSSDSSAVKEATYKFLMSDRLNIYLTSKGTNYNLCDETPNYYDDTYNNTDYNGVPVIVLDGHEAQHLGDYAALLLTNGGGAAQSSTMATMKNNGVVNITCLNAVIKPDGTIIKNDGTYGSGDNTTKTSIACTNGYTLSLENCPYDERVEKDGNIYYTITLLQYNYKVKTTTGTHSETIYIPIFVKEKVTIRSSVRILSGEDYSYTNAKAEGKSGELVIAHGSYYTIFAELAYDSIRLKEAFKDITVKKTLVFANTQESIPEGTRLTLVDSQTGKDYYYTIGDEYINQIPLTAFTNNGVAYTERKIGTDDGVTLTASEYEMFDGTVIKGEAGIERYYIFVEPPEGDHNITFDFEIKAEPVDQNGINMDGYFKKYLDEKINMEFIPGPQISFAGVSRDSDSGIYTGTENITYAIGTISQEKTLDIDATIDISLADSTSPYWTKKDSTIDSTNNGKYLDIAVSLIDENGQEIAWPEGTNVIFNGGTPQTVSGSVLYLYKDSSKELAYDSLERDINGDRRWYYYSFYDNVQGTTVSKWITSDDGENYYYFEDQTEMVPLDNVSIDEIAELSNYTNVTFDFSLADVADYAGNKYTVMLKLYRSTDPEYPIEEEIKESENKYTEYKEEVYGELNREMGAAVSVKDTMNLGINVYQNFNSEEIIPFTNKFDFTNVINSRNATKAESDIEECAASEYMVTYRIQKKNSEGKYVTIDWEDSPYTLSQIITDTSGNETFQDMTVTTMNGQSVYVEYKKFTADEIKTGVDGVRYVTSWDMQITADVNKLKETEENWSNYKLSVTYLPYDPAGDKPENDNNATLIDYFIFTVAKLKTDM